MISHCGTQAIETSRLLLRPLDIDDAQMMYGNWASDPEVTRYLRWDPHSSWSETAELLYEWSKHYTEPDFYYWGLTDKVTGALFGSLSIQRSEPDSGWQYTGLDWDESWEPGFCLGQKWWNKGYATEALAAVCRYWFDNTDASWLACSHAEGNPACGRVLQKAGFVYDHNCDCHRFDGSILPSRAYYMVRHDITKD